MKTKTATRLRYSKGIKAEKGSCFRHQQQQIAPSLFVCWDNTVDYCKLHAYEEEKMKLTHAVSIAIAIISTNTNASLFINASSTCGDCQPSTGYLVTRLWNIMPGTTDQEVIDEFNKGFAPVVTKMDGFYIHRSPYWKFLDSILYEYLWYWR